MTDHREGLNDRIDQYLLDAAGKAVRDIYQDDLARGDDDKDIIVTKVLMLTEYVIGSGDYRMIRISTSSMNSWDTRGLIMTELHNLQSSDLMHRLHHHATGHDEEEEEGN